MIGGDAEAVLETLNRFVNFLLYALLRRIIIPNQLHRSFSLITHKSINSPGSVHSGRPGAPGFPTPGIRRRVRPRHPPRLAHTRCRRARAPALGPCRALPPDPRTLAAGVAAPGGGPDTGGRAGAGIPPAPGPAARTGHTPPGRD